jgi:hypothetical protein
VNRPGPRALLLALVAVALTVPWSAPIPSRAAPAPFAFELEVERPSGQPALIQFIVAARSPADAERAARAALAALPVQPRTPAASAAWRPWGWAWNDDELPVPVAYNPTGAPPVVGPQAIIAGLQAWSSVEGSRFSFTYAGITDRVASILDAGPDGENVVSWAHFPCDRGCVLGLTSKESVHEVDMLLNSNPNALIELGLDTVLDWRTIILHELGHMAGLEHSCPAPWGPCTPEEVAAVMYFQYTGINRTLAADDREGIRARYPALPPPTPPATRRLTLEPGWSLIILPGLPVGDVASALPCLQAAYAFDGERWTRWARGLPPAIVTLQVFPGASPAWVFAATACTAELPAP